MKPSLILASASPRRRELLDALGVGYRVSAVDLDESTLPNESPEHYVERIAAEKSALCLRHSNGNLPVLAADTAVVVAGRILGKPRDREDFFAMIRLLSGASHRVYSAVSLRGREHWLALSITDVRFRKITDSEMSAYWRSGEPADKAGGYAIQGLGGIFVAAIEGSYSGVMGLPVYETAELLSKQGIEILK
ncbi:MAG: Maf family protein [Gammaproteobacteria bacterium]